MFAIETKYARLWKVFPICLTDSDSAYMTEQSIVETQLITRETIVDDSCESLSLAHDLTILCIIIILSCTLEII